MASGWVKIAALCAPNDRYAPYYWEALDHAGFIYERLDTLAPQDLGRTHVLLLLGTEQLSSPIQQGILKWVEEGGQLVVSGSTWGFDAQLGGTNSRTIGRGKLGEATFFGGVCIPEIVADADYEKGKIWFFGPHVGKTIALMQFGRSVECDAVGPDDVRLDDGRLRAEDGSALDFDLDREPIGAEKVFAVASADRVRNALTESILSACDASEHPYALLWHWPNHAQSTYSVTLDCADFDPDQALIAKRLFGMHGIQAAWLLSKPGYSSEFYRAARSRDDEIGLLFEPEAEAQWSAEQLKMDATTITRMTANPNLTTCRPIDGGWRRWTRFYELCEEAGPRLSVAKGGRQQGTQGFLFGTSHPFFCRKFDGQSGIVGELPYTLFRPGTTCLDESVNRIIDETRNTYGCVQLVYEPSSFINVAEINTFRRIVGLMKEQRTPAMTPGEIYRFERARRHLRLQKRVVDTDLYLDVYSETSLDGLSLLISDCDRFASVKGKACRSVQLERYGRTFLALSLDIEAKGRTELMLSQDSKSRSKAA